MPWDQPRTGPSSCQQAALDLARRTNRSQARDREDAGSFGPIRVKGLRCLLLRFPTSKLKSRDQTDGP